MQVRTARLVSGFVVALVLLSTFAGPGMQPGQRASAATRTLYVDPSRSDSTGTGTSAKPLKTIGKAVQHSVAGDLVLIGAGTYAESITIEEKHGTTAAPIEFRASGAVVIDGTASSRDADFVTYSSYVVIDGWTVRDAPRAGMRIDASHHVTVRNGTFANNGRWGIFTDFSDDLLIEHNEAYGSKLEHGIYHSNSGDRPTIRGNVIHGNYAAGLHMNADASMGGGWDRLRGAGREQHHLRQRHRRRRGDQHGRDHRFCRAQQPALQQPRERNRDLPDRRRGLFAE